MKAKTAVIGLCVSSLLISSCGPIGIKVSADGLSATPDPVYYDFAGGSGCGPTVLQFTFLWPIHADYDNRYTPPATVELHLSLSISSKGGALTLAMTAPTSITTDPYTASIDMDGVAPAYGFGGSDLTIEFYVRATGDYKRSDFFKKDDTGTVRGDIFQTDMKSVKVLPCMKTVPTPTPTPTSTPTPKPTKKPKGDTGGGPPPCSSNPNDPNFSPNCPP